MPDIQNCSFENVSKPKKQEVENFLMYQGMVLCFARF